jgi:hypothetical protein
MCGDLPLKATFPKLFSIVSCMEAWVEDHVQFSNGNFQWDISFTRPVYDCKVDFVTSFFDLCTISS